MNFELKTDESSVLKTIFQIMSELSPWASFFVTKDGITMSCGEMDCGDVKMKFEIKPEKLSMFECYHDTPEVFHPSTFLSNLKKVSKGDTLKISGTDDSIELYSVNRKKDMSVRSTFGRLRVNYVGYHFLGSNTPGVLVNTKDFFTACENTNINPASSSVTEFRLIGKFGLEISFETECISRCVTRLGDIDTKIIKSIFNTEHFSFKTQKIMMLKKLQTLSPKMRLHLESSRMIMCVETSLGPLKFLIKSS